MPKANAEPKKTKSKKQFSTLGLSPKSLLFLLTATTHDTNLFANVCVSRKKLKPMDKVDTNAHRQTPTISQQTKQITWSNGILQQRLQGARWGAQWCAVYKDLQGLQGREEEARANGLRLLHPQAGQRSQRQGPLQVVACRETA
jgi:hypothetical protein